MLLLLVLLFCYCLALAAVSSVLIGRKTGINVSGVQRSVQQDRLVWPLALVTVSSWLLIAADNSTLLGVTPACACM
jgi:hypothetical protein